MSDNKPEQKTSDEELIAKAMESAFAAFGEHCKANDYYCGQCGWQSLSAPCVHHPGSK